MFSLTSSRVKIAKKISPIKAKIKKAKSHVLLAESMAIIIPTTTLTLKSQKEKSR
jgi:hypothetical protein